MPTSASVESLMSAERLLIEATAMAWRWHGRQTRKGKANSYLSHLLQVQGLVIDAGGGADEAIAALLHDSLEDAPSRVERAARETEIASSFGPNVLQIVLDCTDTTIAETEASKGPWRQRKERYLAQLRNTDRASRLVAACDKRHNLGDLLCDLRHEGVSTLTRFNAGGIEQLWYYESLAAICRDAIPPRMAEELDSLIHALRNFVDPVDSDGQKVPPSTKDPRDL